MMQADDAGRHRLRTRCQRSCVRLLVQALLVALAAPATSQEPTLEAELAKGKEQVRQAEYDGAIATLAGVVRRLLTVPEAQRPAAEAYLYLGIAYAGMGQVSTARSQFRQALLRDASLAPDPKTTPAVALEVFAGVLGEAKEEGMIPGGPPKKEPRKGTATKVAIGVAIAAAGAGAALVATGGGTDTNGTPPSLSNLVAGDVVVLDGAIAFVPIGFDYSDPDGDIQRVVVEVAGSAASNSLPEAKGHQSGHIEMRQSLPVPPPGPVPLSVSVVDSAGNRSNTLTGVSLRR